VRAAALGTRPFGELRAPAYAISLLQLAPQLRHVHLTPAGRQARDPVRAARAALDRRATATLTAGELENLRSALTKIIAQLRDDPT
jgi:hypothetical protein